MAVLVRGIEAKDRPEWEGLYAAYAAFYEVEQTAQMREVVWNWLMDPAHEVNCFVAELNTELVGLAHYRPFARPLAAGIGGYLDDLFVSPKARGAQAGDALIGAVRQEAAARGWGVVRWITADDNYRARGLYDQVALRTGWITYDLTPEGE